MNICKILDQSPGTEMSSWGTIHFPEGNWLIEFVINVTNASWHSTAWSPCKPAPTGGFEAIREGQETLMQELAQIDSRFQAQMICKEDASEDQVVRLLLEELRKVDYPHSLEEEATKVRKTLSICHMPSLSKKPSPRRRFEVE